MPTYSVPLHVTASAIRRRIMMSAPPGNGYVIQSDSTADEGYSWVLAGGGGGTTNHAALNNLGWLYSGHTHTSTGIAGFNGVTAAVYGYGTAGGVAAYNTTVASFGALTPVEGKWLGYSSGALTWSTPTAAVDWVTFVAQASNPGGASTTSTLYMSDGTEYDTGTLVWSRKTVFREAMAIGEPGTEQADIKLGGTTYAVPLKVNSFGTARAGLALHQHSNTVEPDLVFARARGTTSSHTIVQDTDIFGRIIFSGWLDATVGYARGAEIRAHADGTISTTSIPTRIDFATAGVGTTSVTDRWCILPSGTFRPAADATYQIGNNTYTPLEVWSLQYTNRVQAAVQAPSGGWSTSLAAFWTKTGGLPQHTYNGTDRQLALAGANADITSLSGMSGLVLNPSSTTGMISIGNVVALSLDGTGPKAGIRISNEFNGVSVAEPLLILDHTSASGANQLIRTRSLGTSGSKSTVVSGTNISDDTWWAYNGTNYQLAVGQAVAVDAALSGGTPPGRIVWSLRNSSGTYAERMRLNGAALTMSVPLAFNNSGDASSTFDAIKQTGTTTSSGVFEAATPAEQSSTTVLTSDDHRLIYSYPPDKCGSRTSAANAAGSGTGFMEGITYFATPARNYITGFGHIDSNTSSTTADRGWYLTPSTNSHLTFAKLVGSRVSAKFAVPSDNLRGFVAFAEAGSPTLVPANAANTLEVIRLGVYNNVFTWSISDGTNETTGSLTTTGHTAGTVYEYEIIWTSSTNVTFNIYNADRSALLETTNRTTGIPASGSTTQCFIGVFIRPAATTPTIYYGLGRLRIP